MRSSLIRLCVWLEFYLIYFLICLKGIVLDLLNHVMSSHTDGEFRTFKEKFEEFKSRNRIDLPGFHYDNTLKGTGVEVKFIPKFI